MELREAYERLLVDNNYSFVVTREGKIVDWDDYPAECSINHHQMEPCLHIVPGSFNPLHDGHKSIYASVHWPPDLSFFELSVQRVDKDMVTCEEIAERLLQFKDYAPVIVSRAGRFVEKIGTYLQHSRELVFHVGIDTVTRMKDDYATVGIQGLAATFIVYDRIMNGKLKSLKSEFGDKVPFNCVVNPVIRSPEALAMSSTQIRNEKSNKIK